MKSKFVVFPYFLIMLICVCHNCFAQQGADNSAPDSAIETPQSAQNNYEGYGDTVIKRTLLGYQSDSLQKWRHKREFAYMNYLDSLLKKKSDLKSDTVSIDENTGKANRKLKSSDYSGINKFLNSLPLKIFFWASAIFFIGFIFYKIFLKDGIFNKTRNKQIESDDEEPITGLEEFSEYDTLIHEAETNNNFNLSTRYLYLQTLKTLSDKELINFSPDKTNNEYLHEMVSNHYQQQFVFLTRNYEYVWYGKFLINQFQYQKLKAEFIEFNKKV